MVGLDAEQAAWTLHVLDLFNSAIATRESPKSPEAEDVCASLICEDDNKSANQRSADLKSIRALNNWVNSADLASVWCPST
jgi:hypothetical protein